MRTINALRKATLALALCLAATAGHAAAVLWTLDGVSFDDGRTASGSFIYDATTGTFSSLLITTSSGFTYTTEELSPVPFGVDARGIELVDGYVANANAGKSILNLDFASALGDAGARIALDTTRSFEGNCLNADCSAAGLARLVSGGYLLGSDIAVGEASKVPEPGVLALLGFGLLAAGIARRKA